MTLTGAVTLGASVLIDTDDTGTDGSITVKNVLTVGDNTGAATKETLTLNDGKVLVLAGSLVAQLRHHRTWMNDDRVSTAQDANRDGPPEAYSLSFRLAVGPIIPA